MTAAAPRFLFVPVSGPRGSGEYARSLAIATALSQRWPQAVIHFILSREAPYAATTPFAATLLPASATFHTREVAQTIAAFQPTVAFFDNAGRTAQLRAAQAAGARVVYLSSRLRQRRKAFRLRWMRLVDEHWIAWPEVLAGKLRWSERCKLRWLGRPRVRFLDTLLPAHDEVGARSVLERYRLSPDQYVLVAPGGAMSHRDYATAPQIVWDAVPRLPERFAVLLTGSPPADRRLDHPSVRMAPAMPMSEFVTLIRQARLVISNGGDTLLQALSCQRPCLALPMSPDQQRRIRMLERAGLPIAAPRESAALADAAIRLLEDEAARSDLLMRISRCPLRDAMPELLDAVEGLV